MPAETPCPICCGPRRFLYEWRGFETYRCTACGTESVAPQPSASALAAYYQQFGARYMERWPVRRQRVRRAFQYHLHQFKKITGQKKPGRFLDLGGGVGYWVRAAEDSGIPAYLVECDADALRFARGTLGISRAVQGNVERCADYLAPASFDFVLARHVVEHVPSPDAFVGHIARIVRVEGLLEIETPDVESWEQLAHPGVIGVHYGLLREANPGMSMASAAWRAACKSMSGVNPPKHLWGFTARGLKLLLDRNGFDVLAVHRSVAGHAVFDPLYYDMQSHSSDNPPGFLYRVWERLISALFAGRGMNLCILARRRG